jgi:hypothetical protein
MTRRFLLAALIAGIPGLHAQELPTVEAIMNRYIEVTGGKEVWSKRKSERVTMRIEYPAAGLSGKITRYSAEPGRYYSSMEMGAGLGAIEMGLSEGVAWQNSALIGPRILNGQERADMIREGTLNAALHWRRLYPKAVVEGVEVVDGEECYKVVMTPAEGRSVTRYFQKKSGLEVKLTTVVANQMGEIPVTITVSDYKNFGGVWAPARTTQKAAGQEFTLEVEDVQINPEIPAERFALPAEVQALAAKAGPRK